MKIKIIVILLMLVFSLVPIVNAAGPNYMGFALDPKDVTVGDSFTTIIWVNVGSAIDTASADNITFTPAGYVNYISTAFGNLFAGALVQITPEGGGVINNAAGWAKPITWAHTVSVNGVNRTLATITWNAITCGVVTTTITAGGTALGGIDPGTTKTTGIINVHPENTGSFNAVAFNTTQIDLSWVKFTGDDTVVIRYNTGAGPAPSTPTSGTLLYNGSGTSTSHSGLTPGDHIWYSIWGYNATADLYSISYQSDSENALLPNSPPSFGTPSPTNGSIGQATSLTWSIPINDPEGDLFNWSIECSDGHGGYGTGASNGTKTDSPSGLSYSTTYTVWVNATDLGSGLYTRDIYNFVTKANSPPGAPTPDPTNGSTDVDAGSHNLEVVSTDPDGHALTVKFYWGNGTLIDTVAGNSGSKIETTVILLEYTTYYWYVNVSDAYGGYTRGPTAGNWTFTTGQTKKGGGTPPGELNELLITALFDGKPLPGAVILIYQGVGTQTVVATADTNTDGIKSFSLSDGTYTIHVASPGLQEQTKTITLTNNMAVIFNMQQLGASDYMLLFLMIIFLIIALYLTYTVVKQRTYFTVPTTQLFILMLNIIDMILGFYYFWLFAIAAIALLIAEIIWMRWAK